MDNALKDIWAAGDVAHGGWLSTSDAFVAETMGGLGFDYLCIDMQHGLADYTRALAMLQALTDRGAVPLARVPWNEPGIIGRMLDAGALGVIVPMVNSVEEAHAAVSACRYAPDGARSWGPTRAARLHDSYSTEAANSAIACIPMIETATAVAAIDDILAVDGIDAIYIGPADLSITYGLEPAGDNDGAFAEALDTVLAACDRHGVVPGIHANPALAQKRRDQGFRMITIASDLLAMVEGATQMLAGGRRGDGSGSGLY